MALSSTSTHMREAHGKTKGIPGSIAATVLG